MAFTFEHVLLVIGTTIAGIVLAWVQENLAGSVPWIGDLNQRVVAFVLAVLAAFGAWVVQFVMGWQLFADITTAEDIISLLFTWWLAFSGAQTAHNYVIRRSEEQ